MYVLYCFLIILFAYLGGRKTSFSRLFRIITALLFICIVGFRDYSVGVDSERYMQLFYAIPFQNYQWIEIGFDRLVRFLYDAGFSYTGLFLACIVLTTIPIFLALEKCSHYTFTAILMYILTLTSVTNGMRQCISVAIFLWAGYFIVSRRLLPFLLCMVPALLFHASTIILIPLYFIANISINKAFYIITYLFSFAFCFVDFSNLIQPILSLMGIFGADYADNFEYYAFHFGGLSIMGFLYKTFLNLLVFFMMMRTESYKKYPMLTNFVFLSFILKNLAFNMPMIGRIILYFSWFEYILIPLLVFDMSRSESFRQIIRFVIFGLFAIGFVHSMIGGEMRMIPYHFNTVLFQ